MFCSFPRMVFCLTMILLGVSISGCKDSEPATTDVPDAGGMPQDLQSQPADPEATPAGATGTSGSTTDLPAISAAVRTGDPAKLRFPVRESLDGNWLLRVLTQLPPEQQTEQSPPFIEKSTVLLSIDVAGNSVSIVAGRDEMSQLAVKSFNVTPTTLELVCTTNLPGQEGTNADFVFEGRLSGGLLLGTIVRPEVAGSFARFVPTAERTFARILPQELLPELQAFMQLQNSPVPEADTLNFVKNNPGSQLSRLAVVLLLQRQSAAKIEPQAMEKLVQKCLDSLAHWGPRSQLVLRWNVVQGLSQVGFDSNTIRTLAEGVKQDLAQDEVLSTFVKNIDAILEMVRQRDAFLALESKDEAKRAEGRKIVEGMLKDHPFDIALTLMLADEARESNRTDDAIDLYSKLVALPMQERMLQTMWRNEAIERILPGERLRKLWEAKHGNLDGLQAHLDQVYDQQLYSFVGEPRTEWPEGGNQTLLIEQFTCVDGPTCVATDVALGALAKTWPESMVVSLRYHVHSEGNDPLTNDDSEARLYNFYGGASAPGVLINGSVVPNPRGMMSEGVAAWRNLSAAVEKLLAEKTDIQISATATRTDDTVKITASVEGADLSNDQLRLHIALAESNVTMVGFNQVKRHDMVVRRLIGGERGFAARDGVLAHEATVDLAALRDRLLEYLKNYEKNQSVEFSSRPLDLKDLHVVVFVQEDRSKRVLQAKVVPLQ